jgi:hypothetical protein
MRGCQWKRRHKIWRLDEILSSKEFSATVRDRGRGLGSARDCIFSRKYGQMSPVEPTLWFENQEYHIKILWLVFPIENYP